jgi:hypothetical protein
MSRLTSPCVALPVRSETYQYYDLCVRYAVISLALRFYDLD